MLWLKLNHVSKRGHCCFGLIALPSVFIRHIRHVYAFFIYLLLNKQSTIKCGCGMVPTYCLHTCDAIMILVIIGTCDMLCLSWHLRLGMLNEKTYGLWLWLNDNLSMLESKLNHVCKMGSWSSSYYGCWCAGSCRRHAVSSHAIDYVG